jgi:type IV secretory pathway TraG/TraD family ATPase VirD4
MQSSNLFTILAIGIGILVVSKIIAPLMVGVVLFAVYVFTWVMLRKTGREREGIIVSSVILAGLIVAGYFADKGIIKNLNLYHIAMDKFLTLLIYGNKGRGLSDFWSIQQRYWFYILVEGIVLSLTVIPVVFGYYHWKNKKKRERLYGKEKRVYAIPSRLFTKYKESGSYAQTFLGISFYNRKPVLISNEIANLHGVIVGATGAGKTVTIMNFITNAIKTGKPLIVLDGKGERGFWREIFAWSCMYDRKEDFQLFSITEENSATYNPMLRGDATELKDKIIGSEVFTEPHYKAICERWLLEEISRLKEEGKGITLKELVDSSSSDQAITGLKNRLALLTECEFARFLNTERAEIDLFKTVMEKKITVLSVNIQKYGMTAERLGKMILQDIKTVSSEIQARVEEKDRNDCYIIIDEFSSFTNEQFIDCLNKGRSAKFHILLAFQELADLQKAGAHYLGQVLGNTNLKIIMRQELPQSAETFAKLIGTKTTVKETMQAGDEGLLTGSGSKRSVEEFIESPNRIKQLKQGEAIVVWKHPDFYVNYLKVDYPGKAVIEGEYMPKTKTVETSELNPVCPTSVDAVNETKEPVLAGAGIREKF